MQCAVCSVQCAVGREECAVCIVLFDVQVGHWGVLLCTGKCVAYRGQCVVCSMKYVVSSVQCAVWGLLGETQ